MRPTTAAVKHTGQPTVILAKTIKGYGMGVSGEGQMITHQAKKMTEAALLAFRDRFELPLTDEQVKRRRVLQAARGLAGDAVPARPARGPRRLAAPAHAGRAQPLAAPALSSCSRASSTAPGSARSRRRWRSSACSPRCCATSRSATHRPDRPRRVPHVRDGGAVPPGRGSTRRSASSTAPRTPSSCPSTRRISTGQILEEGITEAGSISELHRRRDVVLHVTTSRWCRSTSTTRCSAISASATSIWAAGDSRTRGLHARRHGRPHHPQR